MLANIKHSTVSRGNFGGVFFAPFLPEIKVREKLRNFIFGKENLRI